MRVLGLDITNHGVFGVEMDTAFGRFEIRETLETSIDEVPSLLGKTERLVVGVPPEISTFRNIQLATKDRKAIKSALEFELEDDLPFEKDNLHYDSAILTSSNQGSLVHIGAAKKDSYVAFLEQLNTRGIDPDIVTTEAWALRCLFTRLNVKLPNQNPVLLIGIEDEKTFFYIHQDTRPVLYHEISFGIKTIERALATNYNAGNAEIQNWIQHGGLNSSGEDKVVNTISGCLEALLPEIKQTELSGRSVIKTAIEQIYVTGELALMPGFIPWLEVMTQKRVELFRPLSQLSTSSVTYSEGSEARFAKALALAMVTIPADKLSPINLRKGAFAKANTSDSNLKDTVITLLPYLMLVMIVFSSTKVIEYQYYKTKLAETDEALKKAVKNYFGGISEGAVRTYIADTSKLKKMIQSDLTKEREMAKLFTENPNSPLDFLKNLSNKIGKDIVLDVVNFNVGSEPTDPYKDDRPLKASLSVIVANPQVLAKLSELFEKNYSFKKGSTEEIVSEGRKVYKVEFTGLIASSKAGK